MNHLPGPLGRHRVEHRNAGSHGKEARVLFGLGAVRARIIGHNEDHPPDHARVGETHEGVEGHVEPHLFHDRRASKTGAGSGGRNLDGDLLVDRPLQVNVGSFVGRQALEDLGGRGPGVGRRYAAAGLVEPLGHGFVAQEEAKASSRVISRMVRGKIRGQSPSLHP